MPNKPTLRRAPGSGTGTVGADEGGNATGNPMTTTVQL